MVGIWVGGEHRFNRQTIEEDHKRVQVEDLHRFLLGEGTQVVVVVGGEWRRVGSCHMHSRDTGEIDSGGRGDDTETRDSQDVHRHPDRQEMHIAALTPSTRNGTTGYHCVHHYGVFFFSVLRRRIHTHCVAATRSPWIRAAVEKTNQYTVSETGTLYGDHQ